MLGPGGVDAGGNPSWIDISEEIAGFDVAAGAPFLMVPVKFAGVTAVPYSIDDIEAIDAAGAIPLQQTIDDPDEGGFLYYRRWSATRQVAGDVTLRYRAPIDLVVPRLGSGPPFDLRASGRGFSGAGSTFLIVPDSGDTVFQIGVEWNLQALEPGSIAVSSLGPGVANTFGPVNQLLFSYYMAGPLGHYPADGQHSGFAGYWIGTPRFDASEVMGWSNRAYDAMAAFFDDENPPPYTVLLRGNPYQGGGGAALINSFLATYPDTQADAGDLQETIAHEILHKWVGSIEGPPGSTSWFSEGMTVAYTRLLLLRAGLFSADEFLESVNSTATSYYTNAMNGLPNDRIAAGFWEDTRIRSLPYARGALYFADVDAKIRKKSGDARSLDDLLKSIRSTRDSGQVITSQTWLDLIGSELGTTGRDDFEAMLSGELIVTDSEAFGPCFKRVNAVLPRFELGFDREVLVTEPRIVKGLIKGSEADKAGLRDGDAIANPVALETAQSDPTETLTLRAVRDNEEISITYTPRGVAVTGYRWVRRNETKDANCSY